MERIKEEHSFDLPGIYIPAEVLFNNELSQTEKILFGFLRNLSQTERGCWASNKWLGLKLGMNGQTISNCIAKLKTLQYLLVEYEQRPDGLSTRRIFINPKFPQIYRQLVVSWYKKLNTPLLKKEYTPIRNDIDPYKKTHTYKNNKEINKDKNKKSVNGFGFLLPKTQEVK